MRTEIKGVSEQQLRKIKKVLGEDSIAEYNREGKKLVLDAHIQELVGLSESKILKQGSKV